MNNANRARKLRRNLTEAEKALWRMLRKRQAFGCKFRRQAPIGPYIVDFVCFENKLVIEVDGGQHSELRCYDAKRTAWLNEQGYRVIRFWNNQVLSESDAVMEAILMAIGDISPPSQSSPVKGEEACRLSREDNTKLTLMGKV